MTRSVPLVALLVAGCGRFGFDLVPERNGTGGTGAVGNPTLDGGHSDGGAAAGGSSMDAGGTGGFAGGGSGGASGSTGGNGGGTGGTLDGGLAAGGAFDGSVLRAGAGGAADAGSGGTSDSGACVPTNGGVEICDGRDNDCSGTIDDAGVCPNRCSGLAYGGHGYMYCGNSSLYWDACRSACQAAGMDLVVVGDSGEGRFVGDWVATKHSAAWLGGTDSVLEGDWRWVNGTAFWSGTATGSAVGGAFTAWASTEPDNGGTSGADSDCLSVGWSQPYIWDDQRCQNFLDYVCEAP